MAGVSSRSERVGVLPQRLQGITVDQALSVRGGRGDRHSSWINGYQRLHCAQSHLTRARVIGVGRQPDEPCRGTRLLQVQRRNQGQIGMGSGE